MLPLTACIQPTTFHLRSANDVETRRKLQTLNAVQCLGDSSHWAVKACISSPSLSLQLHQFKGILCELSPCFDPGGNVAFRVRNRTRTPTHPCNEHKSGWVFKRRIGQVRSWRLYLFKNRCSICTPANCYCAIPPLTEQVQAPKPAACASSGS